MPIVNVVIRKTTYQIACDEGQESRVRTAAAVLDSKLNTLARSLSRANDNLLLVMTAIMLEDELAELRQSKQKLSLQDATEGSAVSDAIIKEAADKAVAQAVDAISDYIETLAKKLQKV